MLLQQLPPNIQLTLKHFNNDEIRCIKSVLNKAKANYNAHALIDKRLTYEDCDFEISNALKRIKLFSHKKGECICNIEAYIMQTFKRVFIDFNEKKLNFNISEITKSFDNFVPKNEVQKMAKEMFMKGI